MNYEKYSEITSNVLIIGFGSIGQSLPEILLRHFEIKQSQIRVMEMGENAAEFKKRYGKTKIGYVVEEIVESNLDSVLKKYLKSGDILIDVSLNIEAEAIIKYCLKHQILYLNTSLEKWTTKPDEKIPLIKDRTLFESHKSLFDETKGFKDIGSTCAITCGANPGLVSHLVKKALIDMAKKSKLSVLTPKTQRGWAMLSKMLGIKVIQIAERDTQVMDVPRMPGEFLNTWSPEGFQAEGRAPAELSWGSFEDKKAPYNGDVQGHMAYLNQPGCATQVKSWIPSTGQFNGFLIQHSEAVTISKYLSIDDYIPTVYYAYCPCDSAIASMNEFRGDELDMERNNIVAKGSIIDGMDELGVLLLSDKMSMWYGSQLTIKEARKLIPGENATSTQVVANILGTLVWMMKNPKKGVVEPEEMDFQEILAVALQYLGPVVGVETDWKPTKNRSSLYTLDPKLDPKDPLGFQNFLVNY